MNSQDKHQLFDSAFPLLVAMLEHYEVLLLSIKKRER